MRKLVRLGLVMAIVSGAGDAGSADLESGPPVNAKLACLDLVKCAGNKDDGRTVGEEFCHHRLINERRAIVIYAHSVDDNLAALIKKIDAMIAINRNTQLASYVALVGDNADPLNEYAEKAKHLIENTRATRVSVVIPGKKKNGWDALKLNKDAALTVLIMTDAKVQVSHALAPGKLNPNTISAIVADAVKELKLVSPESTSGSS